VTNGEQGRGAGDGPGEGAADDGFADFYEATTSAAFSLCMRITGESASAQDACEAAYIQFWREGPESARTGPGREQMLLDLVREHALAVARRFEPPKGISTHPGESPLVVNVRALHAGLGRLDDLSRRTLELAYFGGLTLPELTQILGMPLAEVRQRLREALLTLAAFTRPAGEGPH
jgi:RNA polymerase sigma-70 factor (ECF subfamily)